MKNFIFINYGIRVGNIYKYNDYYFFYINNVKVYIMSYKGEEKYLKDLIYITNELFYKNIKVNTFVMNNKNGFYTKKDNKYIILLKENDNEVDIKLSDIDRFFNIETSLNSIDIVKEWTNEIDLLEKELIEYNKEYSIIQDSIDYYLGMAENVIELLNNYNNISVYNDSIGHKVTYKLFERNTLNNPFLFIKINKMYDVSNYIKYRFIEGDIDYDEIKVIIDRCNDYEETFLFSCLLYPNVYLDLVKRILLKEKKEKEIISYIEKRNEYYKLLVYCKNMINNDNIKTINWIK